MAKKDFVNNHFPGLKEEVMQAAKQKNLTVDCIVQNLKDAIINSWKKEYPDQELIVELELEKDAMNLYQVLLVVSDADFFNLYEEDDERYISIKELKANPTALQIGDTYRKPVSLNAIPSYIAKVILGVLVQKNSEALNKETYAKWQGYEHLVVEGQIETVYYNKQQNIVGALVTLEGTDENGQAMVTKAYLSKKDMISGENLTEDAKMLFYVKEVREHYSGWPINLSRTDKALVKHLLTQEIAEINEGTIEIVDIARIAAVKSKVVVRSHNSAIDPVGVCVGLRGDKLRYVTNQLGGEEKIDIIEVQDSPLKMIIAAFMPAEILGYEILADDDQRQEHDILLVTEDQQYLSAIGKRGNNVRLVKMLTGWNCDVYKLSDAYRDGIKFSSAAHLKAAKKVLTPNFSPNLFGKKVDYETLSSRGSKEVFKKGFTGSKEGKKNRLDYGDNHYEMEGYNSDKNHQHAPSKASYVELNDKPHFEDYLEKFKSRHK